jgi:hypothetical protein
MGWFKTRSRPLTGLAVFTVGMSILAASVRQVPAVPGFNGGYVAWDAGGVAVGALLVALAVLVWRRVI